MSVLKNKRRTSKIEYEKNFLGLYDVMYGGYRLTRKYWKQNTKLHQKRKVVRI